MDNRRLILLVIFFFSLAMLWSAWQKHNNPQSVASSAPVASEKRISCDELMMGMTPGTMGTSTPALR